VGDRFADELYGENPCGCPEATDPYEECEKDCEEIYDEGERDLRIEETNPEELLRRLEELGQQFQDCLGRCDKVFG